MDSRKTWNVERKSCNEIITLYVYVLRFTLYVMKICPVTKKSSRVGGGYSNRTRATQFNPTGMKRKYANLQKKRIYIPELKKTIVLTLSTKAIKTMNKKGAFQTLKKAGGI